MNERLAVGNAGGADVDEIMTLARTVKIDGKPALRNAAVREKIAHWYCQSSGLRFTNYRTISALSRGQTPGPENSITKVVSAVKQQEIGSFGLDLMDMGGILMDPRKVPAELAFQMNFLGAPGYRIAGGTDEILRNIIAERVLGLPQDMRVDKNVPFNQVPTGST
jgi:alkylation response protein AidB-like acyl-CoA dehydrogenase